jgi:hypothetical protein
MGSLLNSYNPEYIMWLSCGSEGREVFGNRQSSNPTQKTLLFLKNAEKPVQAWARDTS